MSYSYLTVKAERGRPDSLKRPVKIAFNLSPEDVNGASHPYSPIARYVSAFGPDGGSTRIPWHPLFQLGLRSPHGRQLKDEYKTVFDLAPGQVVTLNPPTSWGPPVPKYSWFATQPSLTVANKSGLRRDIILSPRGCGWHVAYHPLETGHSITVPTRWRVQAYIVDDSVTEYTILQPEDLKQPIFPVPIPLDPLPAESIWILSQDNNGELRINNDEFYPVKEPDPVGKEPDPVSKKDPLSEVLERLAVMEKSIASVQEDVATGQRAMNDIRTQLSTLERSVSTAKEEVRAEFQQSIAVVEAKTATLAGSFNQSQDRLSLAHKAVSDTQTLLAEVEKSSNSRFQDLSRRLPQVEAKAEAAAASVARSQGRLSTMEESNTRTQDHIVAVEKGLQQTRDQVTVVQQLIASNTRLAAMGLPTGTAATLEPNPPSQGLPLDHDKRIPEIEARVEKLEKSTGEQRKALRALDRRTQVELSAVQLSVAGLGSRVSILETSADGDGGEAGVGDLSSASDEGWPVTFPHHLADNPSVARDATGLPPVRESI